MNAKKLFLIAALFVSTVVPAAGQPPADADDAGRRRDERELRQLQNDWAAARVRRDAAFLEKFYAPEFRVAAIDGRLVSRAADIDAFASGDLRPELIADEEIEVAVYGATAVVTGIEHVKGTYRGVPGEFRLRFTNVYVRRGGVWQLAAHQGTEIRAAKKPDAETNEETIRRLDDEERRAALARDVPALERLWSDDFTVNAPDNAVAAGKKAVMETFVKSGIIDFSSYERRIEAIRVDGSFAFVMGLETLRPNRDAPAAGLAAGRLVYRRFTNVWKNEAGTWRLYARHANVIAPPAKSGGPARQRRWNGVL